MDFNFNDLNLRTAKVDRIQVGPEWRTENFFPAWRNISYSRIYYPVSGEGLVTEGKHRYVLKQGMMLLILTFDFHETVEQHREIVIPRGSVDHDAAAVLEENIGLRIRQQGIEMHPVFA